MLIWLKKLVLSKNYQQVKVMAFWSQFLTWTKHAKYCLHKTIKFWSLMQLTYFIFSLKIGEMYS